MSFVEKSPSNKLQSSDKINLYNRLTLNLISKTNTNIVNVNSNASEIQLKNNNFNLEYINDKINSKIVNIIPEISESNLENNISKSATKAIKYVSKLNHNFNIY